MNCFNENRSLLEFELNKHELITFSSSAEVNYQQEFEEIAVKDGYKANGSVEQTPWLRPIWFEGDCFSFFFAGSASH